MAPDSPQSAPEPSARAIDAARVLPLVGLFLLLPPVIALFAIPVEVAGVPLIVIYLFVAWGLLVLGAALLARALGPRTRSEAEEPAPPD